MKIPSIKFLILFLFINTSILISQSQIYIDSSNDCQGILIIDNDTIKYAVAPYKSVNSFIGATHIIKPNGSRINAELEEYDLKNKLAIFKLNEVLKVQEVELLSKMSYEENGFFMYYYDKTGKATLQKLYLKAFGNDGSYFKWKKGIALDNSKLGSFIFNNGEPVGFIKAIDNDKRIIKIMTWSKFELATNHLKERRIKEYRLNNSDINKFVVRVKNYYLKCNSKNCTIRLSEFRKNSDIIKFLHYGDSETNLNHTIDLERLFKTIDNNTQTYEFSKPKSQYVSFQIESISGYKSSIENTNYYNRFPQNTQALNGILKYKDYIKCSVYLKESALKKVINRLNVKPNLPCVICTDALNRRAKSYTEMKTTFDNIVELWFKVNGAKNYSVHTLSDYRSDNNNLFWGVTLDKSIKYITFKFKFSDGTFSPIFIKNII